MPAAPASAPVPAFHQGLDAEQAKAWAKAVARARSGSGTPTEHQLAMRAVARGEISETLAFCAKSPELLLPGSPNRVSLLSQALEAREPRLRVALALARAGAWAGASLPDRPAQGPPFAAAFEALEWALAAAAPDAHWIGRADEALAASGREPPSSRRWAELALLQARYPLLLDLREERSLPALPEEARLLCAGIERERSSHPLLRAIDFGDWQESGWAAWRLIQSHAGQWPNAAVCCFWRSRLAADDLAGIDRLMSQGTLPENWELPAFDANPACSALVHAAQGHASSCFSALRALPAVVEAAKSSKPAPSSLAPCRPGELAMLARSGVDLLSTDSKGRTFLHHWAEADREPRDGWLSLCKLVPGLIAAEDRSGRRAADIQRRKIDGAKRDAFDATLASVERSALIKDLPAATDPSPARPRARL